MRRGKYRNRTALREALPERLSVLVRKGQHDCGDHEWYRADEQTWLCYHCDVGVTHQVPWDDPEFAARQLEADAMAVRAGVIAPQRDEHLTHH